MWNYELVEAKSVIAVRANKLKFEISQKTEALNFKEKSLKEANSDLKKLRSSVIDLKEQINMQEEKHISLQAQLRTKTDTIKRLESKLEAFKNTKSIAVQLEITEPMNELKKSFTEESWFKSIQSSSPKIKLLII